MCFTFIISKMGALRLKHFGKFHWNFFISTAIISSPIYHILILLTTLEVSWVVFFPITFPKWAKFSLNADDHKESVSIVIWSEISACNSPHTGHSLHALEVFGQVLSQGHLKKSCSAAHSSHHQDASLQLSWNLIPGLPRTLIRLLVQVFL
jgi:hypothetical protein